MSIVFIVIVMYFFGLSFVNSVFGISLLGKSFVVKVGVVFFSFLGVRSGRKLLVFKFFYCILRA